MNAIASPQPAASPSHHNRVKPGPQIGAPPSLEQIPVGRLSVDPCYQRATDSEASRRVIVGMVKKWDWSLCQPLVIARRADGDLFILDGQHRHAGAVERGDIAFLPCVVLSSLGREEEARTFVELNTKRQKLTQAEVFHGMLAAGDPHAKQVAELLEATDWKVRRHSNTAFFGPGDLECAPMLVRTLVAKGPHPVRFGLAALRAAYPDKPVRVAATLLKALFEVFEQMDKERLVTSTVVNTLSTREPGDWVTRGAVLRELHPKLSQTAAIAQVLIEATHQRVPEAEPEPKPEQEVDTGPTEAELELERQLTAAKAPKSAQGNVAAPAPAILPQGTRPLRPLNVPSNPTPAFGTSGKGWCTQCEALRTRDQAKACQSDFCKLRPHA